MNFFSFSCFPFFVSQSLPFLKSKRIVITGGPGTGKTSVIQQLEAQGFP
ncbi:MAG: AAA family ATPase, partial [Bacteroidota bacterium]